ncbi:SRPBCC domain-containing protein [Aeromicrobium sp.]|uniref:SRPBCC domain-containing protein n=1 Tax=Aeromicrobium sp. TaxID=1871063 RepID=UPI0039E47F5D
MTTLDPRRDLTLQRVIRAPRSRIWQAWTEPSLLERWWIPAPLITRVDRLDVRPGGAFVSTMSEDGETFVPHTSTGSSSPWSRSAASPSPTPSTAPGVRPRPSRSA